MRDKEIAEATLMLQAIKTLLEAHIENQPRSLQKQIGPSELGEPCDHCLAAKLAGWEKNEVSTPWLPWIGTCVHAALENLFGTNGSNPIGIAEQRVTVGVIDGKPVTGSTDLFIPQLSKKYGLGGMTVDWKIVGTNTLKKVKAKGHPGRKYEAQAHLYARGWNAAGYKCDFVSVYFMPRNSLSLNDGYMWVDEYKPEIALETLARAERLLNNLKALETISLQARDEWIRSLPREPDCFDCRKYSDFVSQPELDLPFYPAKTTTSKTSVGLI